MNALRGSRHPSSGFTLAEMATLLCVLAILMACAFPSVRSQMDRMAVVAAREEVVGLFHQARGEAVARGGVALVLTAQPSAISLRWAEEILTTTDLGQEYGVGLTLSGNRGEATLRFDPLGLGRVASQTLLLTKGNTETRLTVSSFGRIRRE